MSLFVFNDILWLSLIAYSVSLFFGRLIFFIIQIFSSFQSILLVWISWIMSFLSPMDQFYQYKITVWHFSLKNEKHIFLYPMVMSRYHIIFFTSIHKIVLYFSLKLLISRIPTTVHLSGLPRLQKTLIFSACMITFNFMWLYSRIWCS